jgi:hypothetical protein
MKIKIILIISGIFIFYHKGFSQGFEWIRDAAVNYSMNPEYPEFPVCYNDFTGQTVQSRFQDYSMIYGQFVLATNFVEARDAAGNVVWSNELGDSAMVQRIVADPQGNVYVAGVFQQTLYINGADSMKFIQGTFVFQNTFILKFDAQGNLLWKKNVTQNWPQYEGVQSLAVDPSGNCWYAMTDFFIARVVEMDAAGNDQTVHTIDNGKTIGNICFDPWGGMYVSGGASTGYFVMDDDSFPTTDQYNMFIARYNPQGQASWAYFGHDITFQRPMITTDPSGNVFFAGLRYDTTSFNGMHFIHPYLLSDFFTFKMDSSGTPLWGMQQPALGLGPYGSFHPGSNLIVGADSTGKFYLGGIHQGPVDWGNGFVFAPPLLSDRKIAITCINSAGSVLWEKIGGGNFGNYIHALAVSPGGTCYFTGSFRDTAAFDSITINTTNDFNFCIGKINPLLN